MTKKRFSYKPNKHYRNISVDDLLKEEEKILEMIQHHKDVQVPRLKTLEDNYLGNNTSSLKERRRREKHHADHRASHPIAAFISNFIKGYMMGKPVKTTYPHDETTKQLIQDINV